MFVSASSGGSDRCPTRRAFLFHQNRRRHPLRSPAPRRWDGRRHRHRPIQSQGSNALSASSCLLSNNSPCAARIAQTCAPETTRSLPSTDLQRGYVQLFSRSRSDLRRISGLDEELNRLTEIRRCFFYRTPLARNV